MSTDTRPCTNPGTTDIAPGAVRTDAFRIRPVGADDAARLRADATIVVTADSSPGFPCRQCLRDADVGEEVVLVSYDPFRADDPDGSSPYHCASPIFLHRHDCDGRLDTDRVPIQLARRMLSLRAFDEVSMMLAAAVVDGGDLAAALDDLFADPDVVRVHVHNARPGCLAAVAERR